MKRSTKSRIAVMVPNQCNPDYRVIKQAEYFAQLGHDVRIFCQKNDDTPFEEVINGVTYCRRPLKPNNVFRLVVKHLINLTKISLISKMKQ